MKKLLLIILLILCTILLVGTVSAFEFDNVLSYEKEDMKVTFINAFNLPLISYDLGTAELKSHTSVNHILEFGFGAEEIVMYYDFEGWELYENGLGEVEFIDKRTGEKIKKDYYFVEWKEVIVPNYIQSCSEELSKIGTITNCLTIQDGTMKEFQWVKYDSLDIPNKNIRIGLKTYVGKDDWIDGVWTIVGKKVNRHAEWTESLNADIVAYYPLDESSGDALDSVNDYDGTLVPDVSQSETGKLGTAYGFTNDADDDYVISPASLGDNIGDASDTISVSLWIKMTSAPSNAGIFQLGNISSSIGEFDLAYISGNLNSHGASVVAFSDTASFHHYVGTHDGTYFRSYLDGTSIQNRSYTTDMNMAGEVFLFGRYYAPAGDYSWNGEIDEIGIWKRTLSQAEVTQLYNEGTGMTYVGEFADPPTITLDSPANNTNFTITNVVMNATIFDALNMTNVSLIIDDVYNETNSTTGINNTVWTFTKNMGEGDFYWTLEACNFNNECANGTQRTFGVDTTPPVLTVANLTNATTTTFPFNSTWTYSASDSHIGSCYYNTTDDSTYQTITCNSTINTEWATEGAKTIQYCANDTFGLETCNTSAITIIFYTYYQERSPATIGEGSPLLFTLFVNMTDSPLTSAILTFNNTNYADATITTATNYTRFDKTLMIPDGFGTPTGANLTGNWSVNLSGIANVTTDNFYTTVFSVVIDDCGTYGTTILNYTLNDEEDRAFMDAGQLIEYDINISNPLNTSQYWTFSASKPNVNTTQVCVPTGLLNNSFYTLDVTTIYEASSHVVEFNYIDNYNLSSIVQQDISLYDLNSSVSTSFLIEYQDENYLPVANAIIDLLRFYVGDGIYLSVENGRTDDNGQTVLHLVTEEVQYRAVVNVNGETVFTSPDFLALCQETPCQINLQRQDDVSSIIDYATFGNLNYGLVFNETTRDVTLTYTTRDSSSSTIVLNVTRWDAYLNTSVCTETATSSAGTLVCNVPLTARNMTYYVEVRENGDFVTLSSFSLNPSAFDNFGYTGIIMVGLLFLTLVLMAVPSGAIATLVFGVMGLVFASMLTLFAGGSLIGTGSALMWLIIAIAIIIVKIANRTKHS